MKKSVILSIRGTQTYPEQEPEVIELVTEGKLTEIDGGWDLCYEESPLTGLEGVTTCFQIRGDTITLIRTGKLHSKMVFKENVVHESLYRVEFGALMLTVCASKVEYTLSEQGGVVDLVYSIDIEQSTAGQIEYHLQIRPKE